MNILNSIQSIGKYNQNIVVVYTTTASLLASAIVWIDASDSATILDSNNSQVVAGGTTVSKWLNKNNTAEYFLAQNSLTNNRFLRTSTQHPMLLLMFFTIWL